MTRPLNPFGLALSALLALAATLCSAGGALAGEAACWFEGGVVVVGAEVMGVAGDYILDTATPHTQLADSQAQTAGFTETALVGEVRLAGITVEARPVSVAVLDLRTGALPTPVAGVIGADVLRGYVVDVSFAPCRVALRPAGQAPALRGRTTALPIAWVAGRPVVAAAVADGPRAFAGAFAPATGGDRALRISDAYARARGPPKARLKELYPYGVLQPRLRAFSFAGRLSENLRAGLVAAEDPALAGEIGAPLLAQWRLRFDFPAGKLILAPARVSSSPRRSPREEESPRKRATALAPRPSNRCADPPP